MEKETVQRIKEAVRSRRLTEPFRAADVNRALRIHWAGVFLPKHRVGNPDDQTEQFVRVSRGLYCLKCGVKRGKSQ